MLRLDNDDTMRQSINYELRNYQITIKSFLRGRNMPNILALSISTQIR